MFNCPRRKAKLDPIFFKKINNNNNNNNIFPQLIEF